jgi:hypothetical protein
MMMTRWGSTTGVIITIRVTYARFFLREISNRSREEAGAYAYICTNCTVLWTTQSETGQPQRNEFIARLLETLCPLSRVHIDLFDVPPTQTFSMTIVFTASLRLMLSASKNTTKLNSGMWSIYGKSLKISFWSWVLRLLLDVRTRIYQVSLKFHYWIFLIISRRVNNGWGFDWCFCTKWLFQR